MKPKDEISLLDKVMKLKKMVQDNEAAFTSLRIEVDTMQDFLVRRALVEAGLRGFIRETKR